MRQMLHSASRAGASWEGNPYSYTWGLFCERIRDPPDRFMIYKRGETISRGVVNS